MTMKKILSLAFGTMLFASCSKTFIQIVDVNGSIPVENNKFVYSDNAVRITYSMWDTYSGAYPFRIPGLQLAVRRVIIGTF